MNKSAIIFGIASLILLGNTIGTMAGLVKIDSDKNTAEQAILSPQVVVYPEIRDLEKNLDTNLPELTLNKLYHESMYFDNNSSNKIFLTPVIDITAMKLLSFNTIL